MLALKDGDLDQRIKNDPRLSKSQRDSIARLAEADPRAAVTGLDQKMRPVVIARVGGSGTLTRTALMRNGDPAKPAMPLAERWSGGRTGTTPWH